MNTLKRFVLLWPLPTASPERWMSISSDLSAVAYEWSTRTFGGAQPAISNAKGARKRYRIGELFDYRMFARAPYPASIAVGHSTSVAPPHKRLQTSLSPCSA